MADPAAVGGGGSATVTTPPPMEVGQLLGLRLEAGMVPVAPIRRGLLITAPPWPVADPVEVSLDPEIEGVATAGAAQERWLGGFAVEQRPCGAAPAIPAEFCAPLGDKPSPDDNEPWIEIDPYLVLGMDRCTTADQVRDRVQNARDLLLATESYAVERELWTGAIAAAEGSPNRRFVNNSDAYPDAADATVLNAGAALSPALALARLEQTLADCLHGQRGMIHARPDTVSLWAAANLVYVAEPNLVTAMGTLVVAGSGYPGTGPTGQAAGADGASAWAYGTGLVYVRQGAIMQFPERAQRIDRLRNDELALVERGVAAVWSSCCLLAVNVDHTSAVDGGAP